MILKEEDISRIRADFDKMESRDDLLKLLNFAKPFLYGKSTIPFELKQLTYYTLPKLAFGAEKNFGDRADVRFFDAEKIPEQNTVDRPLKLDLSTLSKFITNSRPDHRYQTFSIKKKSGELRTIHAPTKGLKAIQRTLALILQCIFEPHKAAMGFVKDKSIVDNARIHVGSNYVYNIDLKDFFPSVDQARVWKCFQLKPFYLNANNKREFNVQNDLRIGYGTFTTDQNETIHYSISREEGTFNFILFPDKGDYKMYEQRFVSDTIEISPFETIKINRLAAQGDVDAINRQKELRERENKKKEELDLMWKDALANIGRAQRQRFEKQSRLDIAKILASLCCTEMEVQRKDVNGEWKSERKNVLPQGAPTSPVITNIVCQRLDFLLSGVATKFGLKYTRYADDITFSSFHNVYQPGSDFLKEIGRIITEQKFHIKERKTRLQKRGYRQEVTGLLVNEQANVQKRYIKQVRLWLYYWERYGYYRAYSYFLQRYLAEKGHVRKNPPDMANVISGKLDYLKMVKGTDNRLYSQLVARFNRLTEKNDSSSERQNHLIEVIDILLTKGVDDAMNFYKLES